MKEEQKTGFLALPWVGSVFTIASGVSFLFLCMILPLVGPAATHGSGSPGAGPAPQLPQNRMAFTGVLLLSLALAVLAVFSKMERRKIDKSPLPIYSFLLVGLCVLLLVAFVTGALAW
ncbi:MAG TPA: hypothetical protein PLE77_14010 [Kiritimatiellia bacterium]|nr:hypothetical protein [Kiritimatiellia bacterium]